MTGQEVMTRLLWQSKMAMSPEEKWVIAEAIWGLWTCAVSRAEITSTIISLKQS